MMPNMLTLKPLYNSYIDILLHFRDGKPLDSKKLHFLYSQSSKLSNPQFDPVMKYYGISQHKNSKSNNLNPTFVNGLPNFYSPDIKQLKPRLDLMLKNQTQGVFIPLTAQQLQQLRGLGSIHDVMFWHGNHTLTGAPFFHGGIPHVDFFQWGNLFGVIKYEELTGEKEEGNILVYFEDMQDRLLSQCVDNYWHKLYLNREFQNKIATEKLDEHLQITPKLELRPYPFYKR